MESGLTAMGKQSVAAIAPVVLSVGHAQSLIQRLVVYLFYYTILSDTVIITCLSVRMVPVGLIFVTTQRISKMGMFLITITFPIWTILQF